jgi:hypothetical protein
MNAVAVNTPLDYIPLDRAELLRLCAVDSTFYGRQFFPKTFRQASPWFHRDFWTKFEDPLYDFFAAEMFRGSAKTTLCRVGISKRIAYGLSRNTLAVAISESMAIHTVNWIRKQMETNAGWTSMFGLRKGSKWTDNWISIINEPYECEVHVVAKGMTSGLRGLNLDDYRPDFIYCDDVCDEENTATEEQRNKTNDLIFGALVPSLAPKSEAPTRKFALTNTGQHKDDAVNKAQRDPTFLTVKYPKLITDANGALRSTWEERFPTKEAIQERDDYTARNQYHIWQKEYGCKIVSRETAPLQVERLRFYKTLPTNLIIATALDPATKAFEASKAKKLHKTAGVSWGMDPKTGECYLLGYKAQRNMDPDEIWVWLADNYRTLRPRKIGVETVAFQKMLKWYMEKKMQEERLYFVIQEINDKRSKQARILQAYNGLAAHGKLLVSENHTEFRQEYEDWTEGADVDLLDAGAMALSLLNPWMIQTGESNLMDEDGEMMDESDIPDLVFQGGCP